MFRIDGRNASDTLIDLVQNEECSNPLQDLCVREVVVDLKGAAFGNDVVIVDHIRKQKRIVEFPNDSRSQPVWIIDGRPAGERSIHPKKFSGLERVHIRVSCDRRAADEGSAGDRLRIAGSDAEANVEIINEGCIHTKANAIAKAIARVIEIVVRIVLLEASPEIAVELQSRYPVRHSTFDGVSLVEV